MDLIEKYLVSEWVKLGHNTNMSNPYQGEYPILYDKKVYGIGLFKMYSLVEVNGSGMEAAKLINSRYEVYWLNSYLDGIPSESIFRLKKDFDGIPKGKIGRYVNVHEGFHIVCRFEINRQIFFRTMHYTEIELIED